MNHNVTSKVVIQNSDVVYLIPESNVIDTMKAGIVLVDNESKRCFIIDVACPAEKKLRWKNGKSIGMTCYLRRLNSLDGGKGW